MATSLLAAILFREKLKKAQTIGLIFGTFSLIVASGVIDGLFRLF